MSINSSVVLIIYKRPELTKLVFDRISKARPEKFFIIADGPKEENDEEDCLRARKVVKDIDWDCEVKRNYSDINLGCRKRVSSGLNWVFSHVEDAIILEDDCLPDLSFFGFCKTLLEYYRHDQRVWMISGNNFQNGHQKGESSYYFSYYPHCWGWATWRRAWENYDDSLSKWSEFKDCRILSSLFQDPAEVKYWENILNSLAKTGQPDSWAYRWAYSCWKNSALTVLPNVNLVSNIGFGNKSTNTHDSNNSLANLATQSIVSIKHPSFIVRDSYADKYTFNHCFGVDKSKDSLIRKFLGSIKNELLAFRL